MTRYRIRRSFPGWPRPWTLRRIVHGRPVWMELYPSHAAAIEAMDRDIRRRTT